MSADDRLARLRDVPIFAGLDEDVLERIRELTTEIECPAGQVLARGHDPGAGMFVGAQRVLPRACASDL